MRYKFNTVIQYAMVEVCALRVELYCRGRTSFLHRGTCTRFIILYDLMMYAYCVLMPMHGGV